MHTKHIKIILCIFLSAIGSFAVDPTEQKKAVSVREKFVPGKPSDGKRASFSKLRPFPYKDSKTLVAEAHAGIGDHFPVQEKDNQTLFEVFLVDGNDDHLVLEIRSKGSPQKVDLPRDATVELAIDGAKYRFLFPTVTVSSAVKRTTNQAMILVKRQQ